MKSAHTPTRRLFPIAFALSLLCLSGLLVALVAPHRQSAPQSSADATKFPTSPQASASTRETTPLAARALDTYGQMELSFEANRGQTDASVNFLARGAGYTLFLKPEEAVFVLARQRREQPREPGRERAAAVETDIAHTPRATDAPRPAAAEPPTTLRMKLVGAHAGASVEGADELAGKVNYFKGNDPSVWRANVPTFGRVRYREVYPGIDVVYYGNQRQLEYDFVIAPGGDAQAVRLDFEGADKVEVDARGDLLLTLGDEVIRQPKPFVYQEVAGVRREVESGYAVGDGGQVGFAVGAYDAERPLIIDPVLIYSTYLGGTGGDVALAVAVDSAANAYVSGFTTSTNFPTANAYQSAHADSFQDAFVSKIRADGSAFIYSTYFGGNAVEQSRGLAADSAGNAYVVGQTNSTNFPTANAIKATKGSNGEDVFLTKFNPEGSALVFSTYLGGTDPEFGQDITLDSSGNVYITGSTFSTNFPTLNPIQTTKTGSTEAFIAKIKNDGSALVYSTLLGGGGSDIGHDIAVDAAGSAYVTGDTTSTNFPTANAIQAIHGGGTNLQEGFVTKLDPDGSALVYSTYLGGSDDDGGLSVAVDAAGNAYIGGFTFSTNFPTAKAIQPANGGGLLQDGFITKLNPSGNQFIYSTYLGGLGGETVYGVAADAAGNAYLAGGTGSSTTYPTLNALYCTNAGGVDAFITKLNATGSAFFYSTYFGGSDSDDARDIALDSSGNAYIVGQTRSPNFPVFNAIQSTFGGDAPIGGDAFIAKFNDELAPNSCATPTPTPTPTPTATATPTPTPTPTPSPTPGTVQFSSSAYPVNEGGGSVVITVTRTGDASAPASVDYATEPDIFIQGCNVTNNRASERCDYTTTIGTLRFAAGETSKTFSIFITDDSYVEGDELFYLSSLSNPTGGLTLGTPAFTTIIMTDNDTDPNAPNPIDTASFFVRMHYIDFLNREGEPAGRTAWTNALNNCPAGNLSCDRVGVSSAFFRSEEFMLKGFFVIRFYKVSLGPPPNYRDFVRDSQRVTGQTAAEVIAARDAFTNEWVQRADFKAIYDGLSNQQYVDKLEQTAGVTLANKAQLVAALDAQTKTRAQVLREVVESQEVRRRMYNDAFVLMEYYGYLRRDPELAGFNAWLNYLNTHPGEFRTMVHGFIFSQEYRMRFGQP